MRQRIIQKSHELTNYVLLTTTPTLRYDSYVPYRGGGDTIATSLSRLLELRETRRDRSLLSRASRPDPARQVPYGWLQMHTRHSAIQRNYCHCFLVIKIRAEPLDAPRHLAGHYGDDTPSRVRTSHQRGVHPCRVKMAAATLVWRVCAGGWRIGKGHRGRTIGKDQRVLRASSLSGRAAVCPGSALSGTGPLCASRERIIGLGRCVSRGSTLISVWAEVCRAGAHYWAGPLCAPRERINIGPGRCVAHGSASSGRAREQKERVQLGARDPPLPRGILRLQRVRAHQIELVGSHHESQGAAANPCSTLL